MPLNQNAMVVLANTLRATLLFAQLHSAAAGAVGTDNIAVAGRRPVFWGTPAPSGQFGLISAIDFTAGTPLGAAYSVSLWDAETSGVYYGEFVLGADSAFNSLGEYHVTVIDLTGTASGA